MQKTKYKKFLYDSKQKKIGYVIIQDYKIIEKVLHSERFKNLVADQIDEIESSLLNKEQEEKKEEIKDESNA